MNLRRLQYFVGFARNIDLGADHLDWESMRSHIAALEKALGFELVHKKGPQARRLTAAGQHYVRDAERILEAHQRALAAATDRDRGMVGRLRIGLCEDACTLHFGRALRRFSQDFPEVRIDVMEGDSIELARAVRSRDADLALTLPLPPEEGLAMFDAWSDPWNIALHPAHPLQSRKLVTCADLAGEPLVLGDPLLPSHGHEYIRQAFREHRIEPRIGTLGVNRTTMLMFTAAGRGPTFVPQAMVRVPAQTGGSLIPLEFRRMDIPPLRIRAALALSSPPRTALEFVRAIEGDESLEPSAPIS